MSYEPTRDPLFAALQAEYLQLQKTIEDFDARALTIKAWSVTFGLTALAGGIRQSLAHRFSYRELKRCVVLVF
jgi:hypothetical protein